MPDYFGDPCSGLAAYETGAGSIRTVFGQGTVLQYAERGIWGNLKDGMEILPELGEKNSKD